MCGQEIVKNTTEKIEEAKEKGEIGLIDIVGEINTLSNIVLKNCNDKKIPYKYCLAGLKLACKELIEEK